MTVRKQHARDYYTDFYLHGKRIVRKVPGGVTNGEVAQQYENDLKLKMLKGQIGISRINPDLSDLIKEYLAFPSLQCQNAQGTGYLDTELPKLVSCNYSVPGNRVPPGGLVPPEEKFRR